MPQRPQPAAESKAVGCCLPPSTTPKGAPHPLLHVHLCTSPPHCQVAPQVLCVSAGEGEETFREIVYCGQVLKKQHNPSGEELRHLAALRPTRCTVTQGH